MKISLELDRDSLFERFGDTILDEHSFVAYGFSLRQVKGDSPEEQLTSILTEIVTLFTGTRGKNQISLSIYFDPTIFDGWCGTSGPAICLYLGCCDDKFPKSNVDQLNRQIMKMSSYINAESYSPSDNALFLGYFTPDNKTLFLEKSLQLSWSIAKVVCPEEWLSKKESAKEFITTIPAEVMQLIKDKKVIEAGFGAGPGFVAGKVRKYPEQVELAEGVSWIEKYCHVMKAAHLLLDDRTTLWFHRDGFTRYDQMASERALRPGIEIRTPDKIKDGLKR